MVVGSTLLPSGTVEVVCINEHSNDFTFEKVYVMEVKDGLCTILDDDGDPYIWSIHSVSEIKKLFVTMREAREMKLKEVLK